MQIFYNSSTSLNVAFGDIQYIDPGSVSTDEVLSFRFIDSDTITQVDSNSFDVVSSAFSDSPFLALGVNTHVYGFLPSSSNTLGVQYRIRYGQEIDNNTTNPIVSASSSTITFTDSIPDPTGDYIWLFNQPIGAVNNNNYTAFNDFRLIKDWNSSTNTATVTPFFSSDPNLLL